MTELQNVIPSVQLLLDLAPEELAAKMLLIFNLEDPAEALEVILLANHLLRIVDARKEATNPVRP